MTEWAATCLLSLCVTLDMIQEYSQTAFACTHVCASYLCLGFAALVGGSPIQSPLLLAAV